MVSHMGTVYLKTYKLLSIVNEIDSKNTLYVSVKVCLCLRQLIEILKTKNKHNEHGFQSNKPKCLHPSGKNKLALSFV